MSSTLNELYAAQEAQRQLAARQQQRLDEAAQAKRDEEELAKANERVQALALKAQEEQFMAQLPENQRLVEANHAVIAEVYVALDAHDIPKALALKPRLEQSFDDQQGFKRQLVASLNAEYERASAQVYNAQIERAQREGTEKDFYINDRAAFNAERGAKLRRMNQIQNAISPGPALAAYIARKPKGSTERQIAMGLCFAMCGALLDPSDNYDAQAATDQQILAPWQAPPLF